MWGELTQADWKKLVRRARRVTRNARDAEDATQDALLRIWRTNKWRGDARFTTYAGQAVVNAALNICIARRRAKRGGGWTRVDMPENLMTSGSDPLRAVQYWRKCLAAAGAAGPTVE